MQFVLRLPYLALSIVFVLVLYVLCAAANYTWVDSPFLQWLVYEEILSTHEDSFLEVLSAVLWLCLVQYSYTCFGCLSVRLNAFGFCFMRG